MCFLCSGSFIVLYFFEELVMVLVRRARKSIRERRIKASLKELTTNLEKVEMKAHLHNKERRKRKRETVGAAKEPIPPSVLRGEMNEELFQIECQLHAAAGLPPPVSLEQQLAASSKARADRSARIIGFVTFKNIVDSLRNAAKQ